MTLTYAEVGATAREVLPPGYRHVRRSRLLRRRDFDAAADDLLTWGVHRRAGLRVPGDTPRAAPGSRVRASFGVGPLRAPIPCEVVYVVDEPDRRGFAYGTLPGHPVRGEELFVITRQSFGRLRFEIVAFSRPANLLVALGGAAAPVVQGRVTARYLRALDEV